ncbi:MAG TPA: 4Fe-4S binding protein [Anaerolineales bacterium]|nr:4Fe-4S binding protein [Anaerolineales bacterium]
MTSYELTRSPFARAMLKSRWPQLAVQLGLLGGLGLVIASGLLGTPVGSRSFAIVMVWIVWWAALMLVAVPWLGRAWCSVCPLPLPGEWLQRGVIGGPPRRGSGSARGLRWPRRLRGMWVQNGAFLAVAILSLPVLTQPRWTGILLVGLIVAAVALGLIFERRAFCRYVCPVGGFIGLYSQVAPVEVRVRDAAVCAAHTSKTCYTGNESGYGCPWNVFPGSLQVNTYCGLCMECLRTCPHDNVAINLRPVGADLTQAGPRAMDEAFKAILLLGSGLAYTALLLGPWGRARAAAAAVGSGAWLLYALGFLTFVAAALPALLLAATRLGLWLSRIRLTPIAALRTLSPALIPLGLSVWIAFSLSFLLANLSYAGPVLSDPLNLGWNLLGTAGVGWAPLGQVLFPWLTIGILIAGLAWSSQRLGAIAEGLRGGPRLAWPMRVVSLMLTIGVLAVLAP